MMTVSDDTIVAVSSPPGRSVRGLIRLSGPDAHTIVQKLIGRGDVVPGRLSPCRLHVPMPLAALCLFLKGPRTFTGQDMAEVQCPGSPALLERIIWLVTADGARLAEPGEFTFRAFLAGKLDLSQAEGVAATIAATSESQLQAATLMRQGELGRFTGELVDALAQQLALVEAGIDFVDQDDVVPITPGELDKRLAQITARLADLLIHSRSWGALEALPRIVLVGAPATGKSTLFNALLGRQRAVVSPIPGTTRDILTEPLRLTTSQGQPIEVMLVDMAGLDDAMSVLDERIQAGAHDAVSHSDVICHVHDGDVFPTKNNLGNWALKCPVPKIIIRVRTKSDLSLYTHIREHEPAPLAVSARTGEGMALLRRAITEAVGDRGVSITADMLALQPRHESALRKTGEHLAAARQLLAPQQDNAALSRVELIADHCRAALDELACLGGGMSRDDIIGRVFETFCIGK